MTTVVLASQSPARLQVLRNAGVNPLVRVSGIDEDAVLAAAPADPAAAVGALAAAKARRVRTGLDASTTVDCVVIGCDSMLLFDGRLFGKPDSVATARAQWRAMAGTTGRLLTGHCVIAVRDGATVGEEVATDATDVHFGAPSAADLERYLASGEPLRVAGGFTLDGLGGWFVDGVTGAPSNVVGLSLPLLRRMLGCAGVELGAVLARPPAPPAHG